MDFLSFFRVYAALFIRKIKFYIGGIPNMKKTLKVILSLACVVALVASLGIGAFAAEPTLQEVYDMAQRALDVQAVENIMSRHVLYHCYGEHVQEMNDIWVQEPQNQLTASFGQNQGYYVGYDAIYEGYGTVHDDAFITKGKAYCEQNGIDTTGMTDEELAQYGGVGQLLLHVTTTAIIEIAKDGKTAKGYWYSPGMIAESGSQASSIWEAYGADFIKEGDEWKLWHLHMFTDFMCAFGDTFTSSSGGQGGASGGPSGAPSGEQSGGQINYEGEQGSKAAAYASDSYVFHEEYSQFSTSRLRSEMMVVPIPLPYDTWSFDVENYGPTAEEFALVGIDVNDWYAAQ